MNQPIFIQLRTGLDKIGLYNLLDISAIFEIEEGTWSIMFRNGEDIRAFASVSELMDQLSKANVLT